MAKLFKLHTQTSLNLNLSLLSVKAFKKPPTGGPSYSPPVAPQWASCHWKFVGQLCRISLPANHRSSSFSLRLQLLSQTHCLRRCVAYCCLLFVLHRHRMKSKQHASEIAKPVPDSPCFDTAQTALLKQVRGPRPSVWGNLVLLSFRWNTTRVVVRHSLLLLVPEAGIDSASNFV